MPVHEWSNSILIADLTEEPTFSDDMDALVRRLEESPDATPHVILNMQDVRYINSSNIAQLLRLRKQLVAKNARLRICSVCDAVWSVILTTGLDKLFEFTDDVSTSLASLQISEK